MQKHEKNPFSTMSGIARKGTAATLCLIITGLFFVAGCKKDNPTGITGGREEPEYPIEVPFTEYSLEGTSCQWKDFDPNKVIIINSHDELENYIDCTDDGYSRIDFSAHSLLLAKGWATSGIRHIDIDFSKETANEYTLSVSIHTDMTMVAPPWLISIIVPKIDDEAIITLNVSHHSISQEKWVWSLDDLTVTLELYPEENKFYTTVKGRDGYPILFKHDAWVYYKMAGDTMYVRRENEEFPPENGMYNKWLIHQHTEDFLEMEYIGFLPAIPIIAHYLFKSQD